MSDAKSVDGREPLVSYRAMFEVEARQATAELRRPWLGLLTSGVVAGISVLLLGLLVSTHGGVPQEVGPREAAPGCRASRTGRDVPDR